MIAELFIRRRRPGRGPAITGFIESARSIGWFANYKAPMNGLSSKRTMIKTRDSDGETTSALLESPDLG